jgi:DinB family protein
MDTIEFFVLHHERLHQQVARDFLQGLSEAQIRLRPQGLNSIAWLVWHMARCENALNLLLVGRPQVLDEEGWLPRLQLSIRDVGTEMSDDEASDLSARIHLPALRDYYTAVGHRTVEVVRSLRPEALDELPDLDHFRAAGVFREKALWAIVERADQTKGWWLGQLGIAHSQSHRGQATVIRLLQGMRR